jgi:molybdate transport system regulatory protein
MRGKSENMTAWVRSEEMKMKIEIGYDIWLDSDGKAFGEACFRLLETVEKTGSLNKAARELNLSYGCVLKTLQGCEKKLGFALLERRIGGSSGGGSCLTPKAKILLTKYKLFHDELSETISQIFCKYFNLTGQAKQRVE